MGTEEGRQARRSAEMRARLCQATVEVLSEVGYERLSTPMIAARAGVSRGAQTHHFPTRNALMLGAFRHLLAGWHEARLRVFGDDPDIPFEDYLRFAWREIFGRPSYGAALELMMAARADEELGTLLRGVLGEWEERRDGVWREVLRHSGLRDDDAFQHINRCLLRGMAVHRGFNHDEADNEAVLEEWIAMVRRLGRPLATPPPEAP